MATHSFAKYIAENTETPYKYVGSDGDLSDVGQYGDQKTFDDGLKGAKKISAEEFNKLVPVVVSRLKNVVSKSEYFKDDKNDTVLAHDKTNEVYYIFATHSI